MMTSTLTFPKPSFHIKSFFQSLTAVGLLLLFMAHSLPSLAQTDSVYWSFGTSGTPTANATSSSYAGVPAAACLADTGNACCAFSSASGYSTLYFTTQFPSSGYPGASGEPTMRNNAKTGGFNVNTSTYFSFTVTPNTGTAVEIKEIHFAGLKNATGPGNYAIRTSLDGYSATVATSSFSSSYGSSKKIHTGLSLQGTSGTPITVRIYTYSPLVSSTGGNVFIDDVVIYYDAITIIPPGITTGVVANSSLCTGNAITIPYTITGTFNSGNTFTAQLSDATGSFSSPVNIGTMNSTGSGNINASIPSGTLTGTGYRIRVISSNPALTGADNGSNLSINPSVTPTIIFATIPGSTICTGSTATFTATITNGGSNPTYQWKKNNSNVGTNSASYIDNGLSNGDNITVELTSNATCAIPATVSAIPVNMTVNALLTPSVTIIGNPISPICDGTPVTFTATPINEGTSPIYQWKKNNLNVGVNSTTYTDNALVNNDIITVEMTSSIACVTMQTAVSNALTMNVTPTVTPAVTINASPGNNICEGTPVTFNATSVNGGTTPAYQWKINGNNTGTNSSTFTSSTLSDGNIVTAEITSNATCAIVTPVPSNAIKMVVEPTTPPTALLTVQPGDTIAPGQAVTFTLYIADGGSSPTILWLKNGVQISGAMGNVYTTNTLTNGDAINCFVQSSNTCANPDTTTSNTYVIKNIGTGIIEQAQISDTRLYPNPNNGSFTLDGKMYNTTNAQLEIRNMLGQMMYSSNAPVFNNLLHTQIALPNVAKGSYLMHVITTNDRKIIHFVIR